MAGVFTYLQMIVRTRSLSDGWHFRRPISCDADAIFDKFGFVSKMEKRLDFVKGKV